MEDADVQTSDDIHETVIQMAIAEAESDLVKGHIFLITPDSITKDEKEFAEKYGFEFKQKRESLLYYHNYNGTVHDYFIKKYGKQFLDQLDSLWQRNHSYLK